MGELGISVKIKILGIPDRFIEHGSQDDLYRECGIDAEGIVKAVTDILGR